MAKWMMEEASCRVNIIHWLVRGNIHKKFFIIRSYWLQTVRQRKLQNILAAKKYISKNFTVKRNGKRKKVENFEAFKMIEERDKRKKDELKRTCFFL